MRNVLDFLTPEFLLKTALPSNYGYGQAIHARHGVEVIKREADKVEAWAGGLDGVVREGGGSRRRVTLTVEKGKLHWRCTGNPRNHQIFCKHCVALALALKTHR